MSQPTCKERQEYSTYDVTVSKLCFKKYSQYFVFLAIKLLSLQLAPVNTKLKAYDYIGSIMVLHVQCWQRCYLTQVIQASASLSQSSRDAATQPFCTYTADKNLCMFSERTQKTMNK